MKKYLLERKISRRDFGRKTATIGAGSLLGTSAISLLTPNVIKADISSEKAYFKVSSLPFHLQHEFSHAIPCNCEIAKAEEIVLGGEKQHAILQRPKTFGWSTITFFLDFDPKFVGRNTTFFSTTGWQGAAEGEVVFSVEINGDIVIDGGRSQKNTWAKVEWSGPLRTNEMRLTLMVDSIRGNNNFNFWWGEPQLRS